MEKSSEVWKDVPKWEGFYQVSNIGNVKSLPREKRKTEKVLKLQYQKNGYYAVWFRKGRTSVKRWVHRVVALAFIREPLDYEQVNHKDKDRTHNCVENLEWLSPQDNLYHMRNSEPF